MTNLEDYIRLVEMGVEAEMADIASRRPPPPPGYAPLARAHARAVIEDAIKKLAGPPYNLADARTTVTSSLKRN